jgi:hypothetical protein
MAWLAKWAANAASWRKPAFTEAPAKVVANAEQNIAGKPLNSASAHQLDPVWWQQEVKQSVLQSQRLSSWRGTG